MNYCLDFDDCHFPNTYRVANTRVPFFATEKFDKQVSKVLISLRLAKREFVLSCHAFYFCALALSLTCQHPLKGRDKT